MTFSEWYDDMEARYNASYSGYEDLLEECWNAAMEEAAKVLDKMAADAEKEQEPSPVVSYYQQKAAEFRETE